MPYDYKAKGGEDFAAQKKDERLFHNSGDHGRLYREGWHKARRDAEDEERFRGFEHAGQTPPADRRDIHADVSRNDDKADQAQRDPRPNSESRQPDPKPQAPETGQLDLF